MKKTSFLVAVVIALASCSKQDNIKATNTGSQVTQTNTKPSGSSPGSKTPKGNYALGHPQFMAIDGGACIPPGINCGWVDNPVSSSDLELLDNAEVGGNEDVGSLFAGSFSFVEEDLGTEHYEKLTSGDYFIKKNYETSDKINYLCGTSDPLDFENFEFVIEFDKE